VAIISANLNLVIDNTLDIGFAVYDKFEAIAIHTKLYGVALGDLDLSDRVTTVTGTKDSALVSLSVALAGYDLIDEIALRVGQEMRFYAYWLNTQTGVVDLSNDLLTATATLVGGSRTATGNSITLSGEGLPFIREPIVKTINDIESFNASTIKAQVDLDLEPNDTVQTSLGGFVIGRISYQVGQTKGMTLTAVVAT